MSQSYRWNWASIYWLCWIMIGFVPVEVTALAMGHPEWTLSDQAWHLEGTGATAAKFFIFCFLTWLDIHIVFRRFT